MNDFFEKLNEKYSEIMGVSVDFIRGEEKRVDKIYNYGYIGVSNYSFNALFEKNKQIYTTNEIYDELGYGDFKDVAMDYLGKGINNIESIADIFSEYNQERPVEVKLCYDTHSKKFSASFSYEKTGDKGVVDLLMEWKEELQNEIDSKE